MLNSGRRSGPPEVGADDQFTVGIDFGTLTGRAIVVRVSDGAELGSAVHPYSHGVMDTQLTAGPSVPGNTALPADWALQVPHDYVEVLQRAVPEAIRASGVDPRQVVGLGTDFTACTVLPVRSDGTPFLDSGLEHVPSLAAVAPLLAELLAA